MSYTRAQWSTAFLQALGNQNPASAIIQWVASWSRFETTAGGGAAYNLLNTEQKASGSTNFNKAGVQNFISFVQGTQTNARVLANGLYPNLLTALKFNLAAPLGIGSAPNSAINGEIKTWGTGATASQIAAGMGKGMNDTFPGAVSGTTATVKVAAGTGNPFPKDQCTWWADERYHQLAGYYIPWTGNANSWAAQAKKYAGWVVSSQATSPAIICLQAGVQLADPTYGHVAVVESINADGSVVCSNSNWAGHVYPDVVRVTFKPGPGVSFISAGVVVSAGGANDGTATSSGNLGNDIGNLFSAFGALFAGTDIAPLDSVLSQVHTTLVDNPGFYGIALAIDEAEQVPGWQNLAGGPFDMIGIIRSVGASIGDNFLPLAIRGTLIGFGTLILGLMLAKLVFSQGEQHAQAVGQLLPLLMGG